MPVAPYELVAEWEKSGLIDKLRQELMTKYKDSEEFQRFAAQVREATTQTFSEAVIGSLPLPELIQHMSQEAIRDSLLDGTIQSSGVLADPNLEASVRPALERILRRKKMAELRAAQAQDRSDAASAPPAASSSESAPTQPLPSNARNDAPSSNPTEASKVPDKMDVDPPATKS